MAERPTVKKEPPMKGMLSIDISRCVSCKTCELECAVAHSRAGTLVGVVREEEKVQRRIVVEPAGQLSVPLQCRHCEDAPCVAVCPTKAMHKNGREFPVLMDEELCIGCRACISVCPFGVIFMGREGTAVVKCDLCIRRLAQGELPACAAGCPTGAIQYATPEEVARDARRKAVEGFLVAVERGRTPEGSAV
jgi:carbon-monoxide dehydrogenase iron sulfur subunit